MASSCQRSHDRHVLDDVDQVAVSRVALVCFPGFDALIHFMGQLDDTHQEHGLTEARHEEAGDVQCQ